jgi:enoyl-CoA hydratase
MSVFLDQPEPGLGVIYVYRPQVRNALDWKAMQSFSQRIQEAQTLDLNALVIAGSKKAFIAGGDLKELARYPDRADGQRLSSQMTAALQQLEALPCPTIAAMNGAARGGGAEISLACDLRVMAEDADMGLVQVKLGLSPGWGAGQRLMRLVGYSLALEWLVTGKILSAQEAHRYGLANRIAPPGKALETSLDLARAINAQPRQAVRAIKNLLRAGQYLNHPAAAAHEQSLFPSLWASSEHQQAVEHFLNRNG